MPTKAERKQLDGAVNSFHSQYASNWGKERWQTSLYPALAIPTRYAFLVNQFVPRSEIDRVLREAQIPVDQLRQLQLVPSTSEKARDHQLVLFEHVHSAAQLQTDDTEKEKQPSEEVFLFPPPTQAATPASLNTLLTHWNMDAASALCASMLDVQLGDRVLDLCAAPGGKSVTLAQSIFADLHAEPKNDGQVSKTGCLHSNELDFPRNKRLATNLRSYLPTRLFDEGQVKILRIDGADPKALTQLPYGAEGYDKVLLDAPCSSERHIIHAYEKASSSGRIADEMVRWRPGSSKTLAKLQAALLLTALKAVRMGGRVVYSTCSIETGENDGVIEKVLVALEKERKKFGLKWDIQFEKENNTILEDMTEPTKLGRIALPDHPGGGRWGPLFFCIITKVAR